MILKYFYIVIGLLAITSCGAGKSVANKSASLVHFEKYTSLEDIKLISTEKGKPVFVDFYTDWCMPCRVMDKEVFGDQRTADYLNENFVSVKINAEKGNGVQAAEKYFVLGYPNLLFLDEDGEVLISHLGSVNNSLLFMLGEQALEKYKQSK